MFLQNDYGGAIRACSATTPSSSDAQACVQAACARKQAKLAKQWMTLTKANARGQLAKYCKTTANIDLLALDCNSDPRDCQ